MHINLNFSPTYLRRKSGHGSIESRGSNQDGHRVKTLIGSIQFITSHKKYRIRNDVESHMTDISALQVIDLDMDIPIQCSSKLILQDTVNMAMNF